MRLITYPLALIIIFSCLFWRLNAQLKEHEYVYFMDPGDWIDNDKSGIKIFCNNARSKFIISLWKTITMHLRTNLETYEIYEGSTPEEVVEKHEENQKYWRFSLFGYRRSKSFQLNPFEDSCIGVYMPKNQNQYYYRMTMTMNAFDTWRILMMMTGAFLFLYAQKLSRNTLFFYMSGIFLGVSLSVIILIYLLGKLLPSGKFMYVMLASGYAMSLYVAQLLWDNAQMIMMQYRELVLSYIALTAFISFIICYRFGPITNKRTKNIIQWILQLAGLIIVYYSSYLRESSITICILLLIFYNFPLIFFYKSKKYWRKMFPEKRTLLTENEYRKEGIIETRKALTGLKEYCSSPNCNPWKTVLKLKDPIRFAKFMEGDSHLSESENISHDYVLTELIEECEFTDDEDNDDSLL